MAVAAMKMVEQIRPPSRRSGKIDDQHSAAGLHYSSHLLSTLLAAFAREMMKHHGGEDGIELSISKRQGLGCCSREKDRGTCLLRFPLGARQHLW